MNISFMGQGAMGSRMADRLVAAGFSVNRWNRTGATQSPREAVAGADVVIAMLRDDPAAQAVWLDDQTGALAGMTAGSLAIDSSTLSQAQSVTLATAFSAAGVEFLDAPVLGSRPQAEAGQLIHLVGGETAVLERARPVLAAMGSKQLHVGAAGAGTAFKLIANALFAAQVALVAELLGRMDGAGLDRAAAIDLLALTPQLSPAAQGAARLMLAGADAPMFPIELVVKDLGYALAAAGSSAPLLAAVGQRFEDAAHSGLGAANITAIYRL
jgi:3-hydroxyisobutyrate dehydrogenase